jgi:hypothetical protein
MLTCKERPHVNFTFMANSAQRHVVGTSRQIEINKNITLVISDPNGA